MSISIAEENKAFTYTPLNVKEGGIWMARFCCCQNHSDVMNINNLMNA